MSRRTRIGLALIVALLAAGAGRFALATDSKQPPAKQAPNLAGIWQLDPARSDASRAERAGWARGSRPGRSGEAAGGTASPPPMERGRFGGRPGGGGVRLPDVLRIQEVGTVVRMADSTGTLLQEIATSGTPPGKTTRMTDSTVAVRPDSTPGKAPADARALTGEWRDGRLQVQRSGWRDAKITQTYALEDSGRTLVIRTQVESSGSMPGLDSKRVYRKVSG